jgi:hypothetical protein
VSQLEIDDTKGVFGDTHILSSVAMIAEAAKLADSGSAAVLGCGRCGEIPIRILNQSFDVVDLIDIDEAALAAIVEQCKQWNDARHVYRFHYADLTGLITTLQHHSSELVSTAVNPLQCLEQLGMLLESTPAVFWTPSHKQRYALLICSTVLTQLQAVVRESVEKVYLERFPKYATALSKHEPWRRSAWNFARNLEDAFISHLGTMIKPGGIIFLSATVHVAWLTQIDEQSVATKGSWIATRTARLADYLQPSDSILAERAWNWLRQEREGSYWGRLYGVQAIIYQTKRTDKYTKRGTGQIRNPPSCQTGNVR